MRKEVSYTSLEDRQNKVAEFEAQRLRMLMDVFDAD